MAPLLHLVVLVKMTESKQFVMQQEILVLQIYQEVSFLTEQLLRIFFHLFNLSRKLMLQRA